MRILSLELVAFGCFKNVTLDFSGTSQFHILYGANETGKSTALRALQGLFYGIPVRSQDAYLHDGKNLRVAARLQHSDGRELCICRRKGLKNTLLDASDNPIPESVLQEFLGGVSQESFVTLFGLNHKALEEGGQDLLAGGGKAAESLFGAGMGFTGLQQVLKWFEDEAQKLFKPGSHAGGVNSPKINKAILQFSDARKRMNELSLAPLKWAESEAAIKQKEESLAKVGRDLEEARASKTRLERIQRSLAPAQRRDQLLRELRAMGDVLILPPSAAEERVDKVRTLQAATAQKEKAEAKIGQLKERLSGINVPESLLQQEEAINWLHGQLEIYRSATTDLPKVSGDMERLREEARIILARARPGVSLEHADALRIPVSEETRLRKLIESHRTLEQELLSSEKDLTSVLQDLRLREEERERLKVPPDPAELEGAVNRAARHGDLEQDLSEALATVRQLEDKAQGGLKALGLWSGTLEELPSLQIPVPETITRFENQMGEIGKELGITEDRIKDQKKRSEEAATKLQALKLAGEVPTEEDLEEARSRRDRGWKLVRRSWVDKESDPEAERAFDPDNPLPDAYELSVTSADDIADRLRREAERVAQKANLLVESSKAQSALAELENQKTQLTETLEALNEDWRSLWKPAGIEPLPPNEMRSWMQRWQGLVQQVEGLKDARRKAAELRELIEKNACEVSDALLSLGEKGRQPGESLVSLLDRARNVCASIRETAATLRQLDGSIRELAAKRDKALGERERVRDRLRVWHSEWERAVAVLGLPPEAATAQAEAVLAELEKLFSTLGQIPGLAGRVQNMTRTIGRFEAGVRGLSEAFSAGPCVDEDLKEILSLTPDQAVAQLYVRLIRAKADLASLKVLQSQLEDQEEALEQARETIEDAAATLERLKGQAGCATLAELEEAEGNSRKVVELRGDIRRLEDQLRENAPGMTVEQVVEEMQDIDRDSLPGMIIEAGRLIGALEAERSRFEQELGSMKKQHELMDGRGSAAELAEEAQGTLGEIRGTVERYVKLRLGSALLRRYVERYREQNQDPLIRRATEVFPLLTLGSFAGVKVGIGEKDEPVLMGVRPSGVEPDEVGVEGMSDGTRDQLYLSLRLAGIERYLEAGEPVPLIVDDILINFDDERARATMGVLAELSRKAQILFFTHHRRLVELAREAAGRSRGVEVHEVGPYRVCEG